MHKMFNHSMATINNKQPQALHFSHLPTIVHMMKLCEHVYFMTTQQKMPSGTFPYLQTMQCMEIKLGTHVYLSVSMTTIDKKFPQALFPITSSSNLHTIQCMEVKLGTHMYFSAYMTTINTRRRMHSIFGEREQANWGRVSNPTYAASLVSAASQSREVPPFS